MQDWKHNDNFVDHELAATNQFERDTLSYLDGLEQEVMNDVFAHFDVDAMIFGLRSIAAKLELAKAQVAEDMAKHLP